MDQDEKTLDLLGIFHFVLGGITFFIGCIPLLHLALGIAMVTGFLDGTGSPTPRFMGWFFALFAAAFILFFWTLAVLTVVSGVRLRQRRSYTFCLVIAAVICVNSPLGVILGVFTIVYLMKDPVKALFNLRN